MVFGGFGFVRTTPVKPWEFILTSATWVFGLAVNWSKVNSRLGIPKIASNRGARKISNRTRVNRVEQTKSMLLNSISFLRESVSGEESFVSKEYFIQKEDYSYIFPIYLLEVDVYTKIDHIY
jgi:hypothetical protein